MARKLFVNTVDLGQLGDFKTFNQTTPPNIGQLGNVVEGAGDDIWRLVKFDNGTGNVAAIDGGVMYWKTKSSYTVTTDASDSEAGADGVAGGCHVVAVDGNYIYIQIGGDQAAVVVAASAVAGDHLTGHASTDNVLTRTAAGTASPDKDVATCLSTRGTTTSDNGASVSNSSKVRWNLGALL